MHIEVAKFIDFLDFNEVFELADQVDRKPVNALELRSLEEGHDVKRDELERVDFEFINLLMICVFKHVQRVVD